MDKAVSYVHAYVNERGHPVRQILEQRESISRFADRAQMAVIEEHVEVTGARHHDDLTGRPRLRFAIETARKTACPIVVARFEQLAFKSQFIAQLMTERVRFIVV